MAEVMVELYVEQRAFVAVTVPDNEALSDSDYTRLALDHLDESGGLEWETQAAWINSVKEIEE